MKYLHSHCHFPNHHGFNAGLIRSGAFVTILFQIETCLSVGNAVRTEVARERQNYRHSSVVSPTANGSHVATAFSMRNKASIHRHTGITSFWEGVRAFAEASLLALAFGFAILLIGVPLALSVRIVYESLSWLARIGGE